MMTLADVQRILVKHGVLVAQVLELEPFTVDLVAPDPLPEAAVAEIREGLPHIALLRVHHAQ